MSQNVLLLSSTVMFFLHCICRKNITVEDNNKKRMNIANFINIYTKIYTYIIRDKDESKQK